jgi:hypothetical protein
MSSMNVWDACQISDEQSLLIQQLMDGCESLDNPPASSGAETMSPKRSSESDGENGLTSAKDLSLGGIDGLHAALIQTEHTCSNFIGDLDKMLLTLQELANSQDSVTGRTNLLMMSCESLMEEQHTLQQTIDYLNEVLSPFDEIEAVAILLGIPVDARGKPMMNVPSSSSSSSTSAPHAEGIIDPRSPEFQGVLIKLSKALSSLQAQSESGSVFKDADKYLRWLRQLQHRATSLVAKAMRDLLTQACTACIEASKKTGFGAGGGGSGGNEDVPLESTPVYQKFRGLGFRMRELSALLLVPKQYGYSNGDEFLMSGRGNKENGEDDVSVMQEVKQTYVSIRNELLLTFVKEIGLSKLIEKKSESGKGTAGPATTSSLCPGIRHAYSVLLRVAQLEQQLFDSLFRVNPNSAVVTASPRSSPRGSEAPTPKFFSSEEHDGSSTPGSYYSAGSSEEVMKIVECLCNIVGDDLRPFIIRESSVDELCRIVTTLSEDVRSQIVALNTSGAATNFSFNAALTKKLVQGLDLTISDTQERLAYCAETQLRLQVQLFDPLPSHLAYPDLLENAAQLRAQATTQPTATATSHVEDLSRTWYPPLKHSLSLLSKLFGVVEKSVFEDFARRCVSACVKVCSGYTVVCFARVIKLVFCLGAATRLGRSQEASGRSTAWRPFPCETSSHSPRAVASLRDSITGNGKEA